MTAATLTRPAVTDGRWEQHAACRGEDPELFWPMGTDTAAGRFQADTAVAVCERCPVRRRCIETALDRKLPAPGSVWGGWVFGSTGGLPYPHPDDLDLWRAYRERRWAKPTDTTEETR